MGFRRALVIAWLAACAPAPTAAPRTTPPTTPVIASSAGAQPSPRSTATQDATPETARDDALARDRARLAALWAAAPKIARANNLKPSTLEVLNDVCHPAVVKGVGGCACCPGELGPDCFLSPEDVTAPAFVPKTVLRGSFTRPKADEVFMADDGGCGVNMGSYGSHLVARKEPAGWKLVHQFRGVTVARGLVWHRDGETDLVVALVITGKAPWHRIEAMRFDRAEPVTVDTPEAELDQHLVGWRGALNCFLADDGAHVSTAKFIGSSSRDLNGDARPDLIVRVAARAGAMNERIAKICSDERAVVDPAMLLPAKTFELHFTFDGARFHPDAARLAAFTKFVGG